MQVREGRPQRSKTVKSNNPEFNEEFHLIVDDPESQNLKLTVKDDDFGWTDNVIGVCEIALDGSDAIQNPHETQTMSVDLMKEDEDFVAGMGNKVGKLFADCLCSSEPRLCCCACFCFLMAYPQCCTAVY